MVAWPHVLGQKNIIATGVCGEGGCSPCGIGSTEEWTGTMFNLHGRCQVTYFFQLGPTS
jgi:hypothetical protein